MSRMTATPPRIGPIRLGPTARAALRPTADPVVSGGFWADRQLVNARVCIPEGPDRLESAGNLHDLRLAAGGVTGQYRGDYPFMDSDVYKWLEAACWQLGLLGPGDGEARWLEGEVERIVGLVADAQQPGGYLNSWFQAGRGVGPYADLRWGHELYCAGHLIQAAVAHHRVTGRDRLLAVARRFADHIDSAFGPPGSGRPIDGIDGHPEVETALVELYRETGEQRYLALAGYFADSRGRGLLGGVAYCQDRIPLRSATDIDGHAVRQLYLLAAAADLAAETGDEELRAAGERLWSAMTAAKTYLTGGIGARHEKEAFGDPYELPADRAYAETCAAIASIQWSWRMALLTGAARYSDLIERTLFNALLAGVSLDGRTWFYVNPLQVRDGHTDPGGDKSARRTRWFRCACCPPNVMRLLASLEHYISSTDGLGIQLHQYAQGTYRGDVLSASASVTVRTDYPWHGRITVTIGETPVRLPWTLSLRIPQWCDKFTVQTPGEVCDETTAHPDDGWLRLTRAWRPGERVALDLGLAPRLTRPDPRVDAARGCVAIERGPLVYCLEQADHPGGGLDGIVIDTARPLTAEHRPDLLGGVTAIVASGYRRATTATTGWWPYQSRSADHADDDSAGVADRVVGADPVRLTAIPYYAWANRDAGAMRVWIPAVSAPARKVRQPQSAPTSQEK